MVFVGIGVIIQNKQGKILIGKRKNILAPYYSIPGGKLKDGETFEECAKREIKEETSLKLKKVTVIGLTNNLNTYKYEKTHTISIVVYCNDFEGIPKNMEPDKCEGGWFWVDPEKLPKPHYEASEMAVENFLDNKFYFNYFK